MNRQTLAVIIGTVALLLIAIVLLYFTPSPAPNPPVSASPPRVPTAKTVKAKGGRGEGRLPARRLIHKREIPPSRPAAPEGAPHVVVVFTSSQRKDLWTPYGGPAETTPFLGTKAAEGVKMLDALAAAVSPHEAAAAATTGKYPHHVDAIEPTSRRNGRKLAEGADTLAERFAANGWFTMGVSANHHYNKRMGQVRGFDWYRDSQPFSLMRDRRITAGQVVRFALRKVADREEGEKARPLFLQLALVDSHKPFTIPPSEFGPYLSDEHQIAPYLATLRRLDDAIDALATGLEREGIAEENTLFVVVADHGEGLDMPPHHRREHGYVLYPSIVEIPWVMWGHGLSPRAVEGLASHIDVAPTVLGLAGLTGETGFDGMDLSAAVRGEQPRTGREQAYADTWFRGARRASLWTAARQCQKDFGSAPLDLPDEVFPDGCFDRDADPTFLDPIEDAELMAKLAEKHAELSEHVPSAAAPSEPAPAN